MHTKIFPGIDVPQELASKKKKAPQEPKVPQFITNFQMSRTKQHHHIHIHMIGGYEKLSAASRKNTLIMINSE